HLVAANPRRERQARQRGNARGILAEPAREVDWTRMQRWVRLFSFSDRFLIQCAGRVFVARGREHLLHLTDLAQPPDDPRELVERAQDEADDLRGTRRDDVEREAAGPTERLHEP